MSSMSFQPRNEQVLNWFFLFSLKHGCFTMVKVSCSSRLRVPLVELWLLEKLLWAVAFGKATF